MKKAQHTPAKMKLLPLRKAGIKQAPPDLAELIRLANLVPGGTWLPPDLIPNLGSSGEINIGTTWPELLERIQELPEAVRAELIDVSKVEPSPEKLTWASRDLFRASEVLMHYEKIRVAYYNLRGLTRGTASLDPLENLLRALGLADLSYLRQCCKVDCGRIFYAGKRNQPGCTVEHSNALRQQRKRDNDKAEREARKELVAGKKRASKRRINAH